MTIRSAGRPSSPSVAAHGIGSRATDKHRRWPNGPKGVFNIRQNDSCHRDLRKIGFGRRTSLVARSPRPAAPAAECLPGRSAARTGRPAVASAYRGAILGPSRVVPGMPSYADNIVIYIKVKYVPKGRCPFGRTSPSSRPGPRRRPSVAAGWTRATTVARSAEGRRPRRGFRKLAAREDPVERPGDGTELS